MYVVCADKTQLLKRGPNLKTQSKLLDKQDLHLQNTDDANQKYWIWTYSNVIFFNKINFKIIIIKKKTENKKKKKLE